MGAAGGGGRVCQCHTPHRLPFLCSSGLLHTTALGGLQASSRQGCGVPPAGISHEDHPAPAPSPQERHLSGQHSSAPRPAARARTLHYIKIVRDPAKGSGNATASVGRLSWEDMLPLPSPSVVALARGRQVGQEHTVTLLLWVVGCWCPRCRATQEVGCAPFHRSSALKANA